jgi:hypothetical protein
MLAESRCCFKVVKYVIFLKNESNWFYEVACVGLGSWGCFKLVLEFEQISFFCSGVSRLGGPWNATYLKFDRFMIEQGYSRCHSDHCVYFKSL